MQKEAAKLLATRLRSNSYRYFAFSPNGENPALLLDTKRITAATFKQRCTPELGIAYRSGSIFVGEIVRDGRGTPLFRVDEQQSTGQIDASKAVLGFNRLRKKLGDIGVRPPEIAKVRLQVGDGEVEDEEDTVVEDENLGFAEQILAWTRRWQAASGRVDGALDDP
jgi:hypothetical protein